eukprot:scaffold207_cov409-Prasinococcus_capsulatus_cf.AAC.78
MRRPYSRSNNLVRNPRCSCGASSAPWLPSSCPYSAHLASSNSASRKNASIRPDTCGSTSSRVICDCTLPFLMSGDTQLKHSADQSDAPSGPATRDVGEVSQRSAHSTPAPTRGAQHTHRETLEARSAALPGHREGTKRSCATRAVLYAPRGSRNSPCLRATESYARGLARLNSREARISLARLRYGHRHHPSNDWRAQRVDALNDDESLPPHSLPEQRSGGAGSYAPSVPRATRMTKRRYAERTSGSSGGGGGGGEQAQETRRCAHERCRGPPAWGWLKTRHLRRWPCALAAALAPRPTGDDDVDNDHRHAH